MPIIDVNSKSVYCVPSFPPQTLIPPKISAIRPMRSLWLHAMCCSPSAQVLASHSQPLLSCLKV